MSKLTEISFLKQSEEPIKFMIIGFSGIIVNFIVLYICVYLLHINANVSFAIGIFVSMTTNYWFNRIWTFKSTGPFIKEYIKYIVSNSIGSLIQWVTSTLLLDLFLNWNFLNLKLIIITIPSLFIASSIGILLGFVFNFILSKFYVFNS